MFNGFTPLANLRAVLAEGPWCFVCREARRARRFSSRCRMRRSESVARVASVLFMKSA